MKELLGSTFFIAMHSVKGFLNIAFLFFYLRERREGTFLPYCRFTFIVRLCMYVVTIGHRKTRNLKVAP